MRNALLHSLMLSMHKRLFFVRLDAEAVITGKNV
jgi:hypothetical protein